MPSPVDLQPVVAAEAEHSPGNRKVTDNSAPLVGRVLKSDVQENDPPMVGAKLPAEPLAERLVGQLAEQSRPVERRHVAPLPVARPVAELVLAVLPALLPAVRPGVLHVGQCVGLSVGPGVPLLPPALRRQYAEFRLRSPPGPVGRTVDSLEPALHLSLAARACVPFPASAPGTPKNPCILHRADWPRNKALPHLQASHFGHTAVRDQSYFTLEPSAVSSDSPLLPNFHRAFALRKTKTDSPKWRYPHRKS